MNGWDKFGDDIGDGDVDVDDDHIIGDGIDDDIGNDNDDDKFE